MSRTVDDIEKELIRAGQWKVECPTCGSARLVPSPTFDLERLTADPNGPYADSVMELLRTSYPENVSGR